MVTVANQAEQLREQCSNVPSENFLLEPLPRGTASVVGLAAVALQARDPQAIMAILTADHFIGNEERFRDLLLTAHNIAQDGFLVTLGIVPTYSATGYGYIQRGESLGDYQGKQVYRVLRFKEKPNAKLANKMLKVGDHYWNSGMFVWQVDRILEEIRLQMPGLSSGLSQVSKVLGSPQQSEVIEHIWSRIESQTIDYGIMEKARNVAVIPAEGLNWSDVGSWDALFDVLPDDENGNIVMGGQHVGLDTHKWTKNGV